VLSADNAMELRFSGVVDDQVTFFMMTTYMQHCFLITRNVHAGVPDGAADL